jgi:hypothetical protein
LVTGPESWWLAGRMLLMRSRRQPGWLILCAQEAHKKRFRCAP